MRLYLFFTLILFSSFTYAAERYLFSYSGTLKLSIPFEGGGYYLVELGEVEQQKSLICAELGSLSWSLDGIDYSTTGAVYNTDNQVCSYEILRFGIHYSYEAGGITATLRSCPTGSTVTLIAQQVYFSDDPVSNPEQTSVSQGPLVTSGCYDSCSVADPDLLSANCTASLEPDSTGLYPGQCSAPFIYSGTTCTTGWEDPPLPEQSPEDPPPEDPPPEEPPVEPFPTDTPPGDTYTPDDGSGGGGGTGGAGGGSGGDDGTITNPDSTGFDPDADNTANLGSCGQPIQCSGDDIACESLAVAKEMYCQSIITDYEAVSGLPTVGSEDSLLNTEIDVSEMLDTDGGWLSGGSCPAPTQISALGTSLEFDFQPLCNLATAFSALIMITAGVVSLKLIVG
jgi:hypothetical protein